MKAFPKSRRTRIARWCAVLLLTLLVGVGSWQLYFIHVTHRLGCVSVGHLYRSGVMPPAEMARTAQRLGLRTVIDFRTSLEGQDSTNTTPMVEINAEAAALRAVGVRHIHLPTGQVPNEETLQAFLRVMEDPANQPSLIHCYHGIGRTELFAAVYHIEFEGWTTERAWKDTRFFLPGSSFSATSEKGQYLSHYQRRRSER